MLPPLNSIVSRQTAKYRCEDRVADHKRTRATSCDQLDHVNLLFDEEEIEGSPNSWGTPWSGSGPLHRELTVSLLGDRRHHSADPAAFAQEGRSCGIANGRSSSNSGHPPADGATLQRQTRQCRLVGVCHERTDVRRCDAVREMRVGPSKPAVRRRLQATASCCRKERWW